MSNIKKLLTTRIISITALVVFLYSDISYPFSTNSPDNLRIPLNTTQKRQQEVQRRLILERYGLLRFLRQEEASRYISSIKEISTVLQGETLSQKRLSELFREGKVSIAERQDGTAVAVLISPIDQRLEFPDRFVTGMTYETEEGRIESIIFTRAPRFDFNLAKSIRDRYLDPAPLKDSEGMLASQVLRVKELLGEAQPPSKSIQELVEMVREGNRFALVALEIKGAMFSTKRPDQKLASNQAIEYYTEEITDRDEIAKTLDKWFASKEKRHFDRSDWEGSLNKPDSVMLRLESEKGEILTIALIRKVDRFMFSQDYEQGTEDVAPVYFMDLIETIENRRREGTGKILIAKACEKALADPDIKNRVIIGEPGTKRADDFWSEKIGAYPLFLYNKDLHPEGPEGFTEDEKWDYLYRIIGRQAAEKLVSELRTGTEKLVSSQTVDPPIPIARGFKEISNKARELMDSGKGIFAVDSITEGPVSACYIDWGGTLSNLTGEERRDIFSFFDSIGVDIHILSTGGDPYQLCILLEAEDNLHYLKSVIEAKGETHFPELAKEGWDEYEDSGVMIIYSPSTKSGYLRASITKDRVILFDDDGANFNTSPNVIRVGVVEKDPRSLFEREVYVGDYEYYEMAEYYIATLNDIGSLKRLMTLL